MPDLLETIDFKQKHILASCGQLIQDLLFKAQRDWNLSEYPWYLDLFMVLQESDSSDPVYRAPNQYWIVSDWFGEQLKSRNQLITNYWGFYIWGRETYNLSISDDQVFKDIYDEYLTTAFTPTYIR